jgi:hypothetical protein
MPIDAASVLFKAGVADANHPPGVTIGGISLPLFEVSSGPNYTLFGANVSQFAGMQEDLRFIAPGSPTVPYGFGLDDIVFSTTPVPEPTTPALLAASALVLAFWSLKLKA